MRHRTVARLECSVVHFVHFLSKKFSEIISFLKIRILVSNPNADTLFILSSRLITLAVSFYVNHGISIYKVNTIALSHLCASSDTQNFHFETYITIYRLNVFTETFSTLASIKKNGLSYEYRFILYPIKYLYY